MEFYTSSSFKRPIRLSESTRLFAYESLNYKYGLDTENTPAVTMDDYQGFGFLTPLEKYDAVIERIVMTAPIRICNGEKISGAATLGNAIRHTVPAVFEGKNVFTSSVSHLTIDFETVLKKGVNYIIKQAEISLKKHRGTEKEPFIQSCIHCLKCMKIWHNRYLDALKDKSEYINNYNNLKIVPFEPAKNFYEAVQSIWFTFAFVRLCGNWPGIGRIDYLLGDYLENDIRKGVITIEEAREILAHFFIKGCEWVKGGNYVSGDAQHYQNILLGGIDENGREVTNRVTYLVLDILEELGISDFPTSVRVNKNNDIKLLKRVSEVISFGGGIIAIYNEDLVIEALVNYGYNVKEARKFANDGCWEVQIPGKTYFTYIPFDSLQILQQQTLMYYNEETSFSSFNTLYDAFICDLKQEVTHLIENPKYWKWNPSIPCTVVSLFEEGCIEKGVSYLEGGPVYNVFSPHIGGLPDVVNSLYAIKKLVFDEQKVTFRELMNILKNNWKGAEALRQYVLNRYLYYGNDNDEVDVIAKQIIDDFAEICDNLQKPFQTPAGVSTFGRQIGWCNSRLATPYGKLEKSVLAGNFSPTPGTDKYGATAIIKSCCKANLKRMVSGAALDIGLVPTNSNSENIIDEISGLIKGFVKLGGFFMQIDTVDRNVLIEAQKNPQDYQNLSVRVSGWNARFVTMSKEWQDMIIERTH